MLALIIVAAGLALHAPVAAAPVETVAPPSTRRRSRSKKRSPAEKPRPKINHVLIISEDGLRADAVATLHLKWHDLMRKRGSYSDHALTIRDASTLPAHASMLSGVEPEGARPDVEHLAPARGLHQDADDLHHAPRTRG